MSFPKYPEYAKSTVDWIGAVPTHWKTIPLRYLTECLDGKRIPLNSEQRSERQGDVPYWGANCIMDYVDEHLFDEELILLGEDGAPFFDRTRPVAFISQGPVWPNNHIHVLRPLKKHSTSFIVFSLNATDFAEYIDGSTRDKLTQSQMNRIPIAWPPVEERKTIAAFLDRETAKIDALVAEQEKLIELLKEKRQAVISHAVTKGLDPNVPMKESGVEWLGEVPEHWGVLKLGYLCSKIGSGKTPSGGSEVYQDSGIMFLRSQNIYDEGLILDDVVFISEKIDEEMSYSRVFPGDILLNITGASLGRTCIVPEIFQYANVNQHVCAIRTSSKDEFFRVFISYVIKSLPVKSQIDSLQNGAAREGLNFSQISKLCLTMPPLSEQYDIVDFLESEISKIEKLILEAQQAIDLLKERRSALISAAVTGKIDVRGLAGATQ